LNELADYRKINGHCNVPQGYSENTKLAMWVQNQRNHYKLHLSGKTSSMTNFRIQELESQGFKWKLSLGRKKGTSKKRSLDDNATWVRETIEEAPEHVQATAQTQKDFSGRDIRSKQVDAAFESEESDWNDEGHLGYIPGRTEEI
jgi:uncharacterized protein YgbK (DUF1537 family)